MPTRMTRAKSIRPAKTDVRRRQPTDNNRGTPPLPQTTPAGFRLFPQHMIRRMNHRPPHPGPKGRVVLERRKPRPGNCPQVKPSTKLSLPMRRKNNPRRNAKKTSCPCLELPVSKSGLCHLSATMILMMNNSASHNAPRHKS